MREGTMGGGYDIFRATPLLRVKVKITVKFPVCSKPKTHTYGVFDRDFGFDSQEWSCSEGGRGGGREVSRDLRQRRLANEKRN